MTEREPIKDDQFRVGRRASWCHRGNFGFGDIVKVNRKSVELVGAVLRGVRPRERGEVMAERRIENGMLHSSSGASISIAGLLKKAELRAERAFCEPLTDR